MTIKMLMAAAVKFVSRKKIISLTPKCRLFFSYQTVYDPVILAMPLVLGQNIRTKSRISGSIFTKVSVFFSC